MEEITIKVHEIAVDGLPDMEDDRLSGRVAFLWDGSIVTGWPLDDGRWEANSDVGRSRPFEGVTHWVEFPVSLAAIEYGAVGRGGEDQREGR